MVQILNSYCYKQPIIPPDDLNISLDFLDENNKYNPFSRYNYLFEYNLEINVVVFNELINDCAPYIIKLDLLNQQFIEIEKTVLYGSKFNHKMISIPLNDNKIQSFIKKNDTYVLYFKALYDIDDIHQLVMLVECCISTMFTTESLYVSILCIYIFNKAYEKNSKILT